MEDALRVKILIPSESVKLIRVLILVLVEDALRELVKSIEDENRKVLILVLVEDALRADMEFDYGSSMSKS